MFDFYSNAISTEKNYITEIVNEAKNVHIPSGSMVIVIDLSKEEYPLTASKKSLSLASSHGFDNIKNTTINLSLNVTSKLPS